MRIFICCCWSLLFVSCEIQGPVVHGSPKGYDFAEGQKLFLINRLEEVSGIQFQPGTDTLLMAVNDEEGRLYPVSLHQSKAIYDPVKFAKSGDYEDLAYLNGHWFVLQSKGIVHRIGTSSVETESTKFAVLPEGEYESLCTVGDTLYALCKLCKDDPGGEAGIYKMMWQQDSLVLVSKSTLRYKHLLSEKQQEFRASAMAKHPVNGKFYILSHLSKLLLVTDDNFQVLESVKLSRSMFQQPEGIAFNSRGDMYISSEGDETPANIQCFLYKPDNR